MFQGNKKPSIFITIGIKCFNFHLIVTDTEFQMKQLSHIQFRNNKLTNSSMNSSFSINSSLNNNISHGLHPK